MVFSTIIFLFRFLPITLALYYLAPAKLKNTVLFLCSLVFYCWGEVRFFPVMVALILINYLSGLAIEHFDAKPALRRFFLLVALIGSLGMLFYFKYANFVLRSVNALLGTAFAEIQGIGTLPLGISFYTFQTLSYSIDVYRRDVKAERNIVDFGAYVVMFPQLIAGPIVKYRDVSDQLHVYRHRYNLKQIEEGMTLFTFGLAKKVLLADAVGALWTDIIGVADSPSTTFVGLANASTPLVWLGIIAYSLQLYFDFSGYSLMGIGMGKMLGFDFPANFNYPYISASIMTQLLSAVVPQWAKMVREEGGRQKMTKWTRAIAIVIAIVQGWFLVGTLEHPDRLKSLGLNIPADCQLVINPGMQFALMTVLIMVAGTMFLMWIGDQITERGVGNGVSLIISVNIIHALPGAVTLAWKTLVYKDGAVVPMGAMLLVALIAFLIIVVALVVTVTQAQRRIPVQYAKRVMGNKMFSGATQYLPLKLNYSGVMPVIFATAILSLPQVLFSQIAHYNTTLQWIATKMNDWMNPASSGYYIISGLMIFFFSYFWVATMFQPSQIAEDLKRNGGYIPGIRPGPPTALFLDQTMQRLTFAGSAFLTLIYFLPSLLNIGGSIPYLVTQFFGGTSLLILVGVLLDMMRQVETTLLSRNYDGFLKKGKLKGKYGHVQGTGSAAGSRTVAAMWIVIAVLVLAGAVAYNAMH